MGLKIVALLSFLFAGASLTFAQIPRGAKTPLDPTRDIRIHRSAGAKVQLPEEYIWTKVDTDSFSGSTQKVRDTSRKSKFRFFRTHFRVNHPPAEATLYLAGPSSATVYLNGRLVLEAEPAANFHLNMHVFTADVGGRLQRGDNVLAMKVAGGKRAVSSKVLVAKVLPAARGQNRPPLMFSNSRWKSTPWFYKGWNEPDYNDSAWQNLESKGSISKADAFLDSNIDAGLYEWPGYEGVSPFLARYRLAAQSVIDVSPLSGKIENTDVLTQKSNTSSASEFTVTPPSEPLSKQNAPSLVLDFGKEVSGRVEFISDTDAPAEMTVQYGESLEETERQPFLGEAAVYLPPRGTAHGPKSAFRYAKIRFLRVSVPLHFKAIRLDGIYYPVQYRGSFTSSDPLLNQIWEVGAYTAHLCMQDNIWDAPKRDRDIFSGDLDVSGKVIDSVFLDHFLMEKTILNLVGPSKEEYKANTIPGYDAFWITVLAAYDRHAGSRQFLLQMHAPLLNFLTRIQDDLDSNDLFTNRNKSWTFVDWSANLDGNTPEAWMATDFEFYKAVVDGAALLRELNDVQNARRFEQLAAKMKQAAEKQYRDPRTGTFGSRWQTNAMAVYSGLASPAQYDPIWKNVLSVADQPGHTALNQVPVYNYWCCSWLKEHKPSYHALTITPFYSYYLISAMAATDHRSEALDWIRNYWGGMIAEGATSFWEAYDPSWPKQDFHATLEADGRAGYFVSLAHGWSSGPTSWLMEQILGIRPTREGFRKVTIRPDLAGLSWAKGAEPTPFGLIRVDITSGPHGSIALNIPAGLDATVQVPSQNQRSIVIVNGKAVAGHLIEDGRRSSINLRQGGHFMITGVLN